jgi:site-specific DNA-cytosine methylase
MGHAHEQPRRRLIAVDLFAGAGGSTVGAEQAGARVVLAANHWRAAIDVHRANHPDAEHWLQDLQQADFLPHDTETVKTYLSLDALPRPR